MITNQNITIFNLRVDKATRREVYVPTIIFGVSYAKKKTAAGTSIKEEVSNYAIRIPFHATVQDGRTYIDEASYKLLTDEEAGRHWTIQTGGYIILGTIYPAQTWLWDTFSFETGVISKSEMSNYTELLKQTHEIINVVDYSDNTQRGTDTVKHWRIGGA